MGAKFSLGSDEVASSGDIFLSYASENGDVVLAIAQWLRLKGLNTIIDKRDFFAGPAIRDEILRVMTSCTIILLFYSKESKNKSWPQFEREVAKHLEFGAHPKGYPPPRLIFVVIDDTPLPDPSDANRIAIILKGKTFDVACQELYCELLKITKDTAQIDPDKWKGFVF
jgi:hypothetical protein